MSNLELFLLILAIFGGIDLGSRGFRLLARAFPPLLSAQTRFFRLTADILVANSLKKKAVAAHVEEVVNQTAFSIQKHLPKGWARRARINWVRRPQPSNLREGDLILRIRPMADQDHTLMSALWLYFSNILFPENRDILPPNIVSSASLAITRAGLLEGHPYLVKQFDDKFVAHAQSIEQSRLDLYADCTRLNEIGLLMGPFVREVDFVSSIARYRGQRDILGKEIQSIIDHMLSFQPLLNINKPEDQWSFHGGVSDYAFLLVSKPPHMRPDLQAYVKRAEEHIRGGAVRIYVIGRIKEKEFVLRVVEGILSLRQLKGIELFPLFRDYRGEPSGVGALVGIDPILSRLELTQRPIPNIATASESLDSAVLAKDPASEAPVVVLQEASGADGELTSVIDDVAVRLSDYEGAWIHLAEFGSELRRAIPNFSPTDYGERNLISVLKKFPKLEIDDRGKVSGRVFVRIREGYSVGLKDRTTEIEDAGQRIAMILDGYAEGSWIFLGQVGFLIKRHFPEFNFKDIGFSTLHEFIGAVPALEIDERGEGFSKTYVRVR